jgi:hypothetical protein
VQRSAVQIGHIERSRLERQAVGASRSLSRTASAAASFNPSPSHAFRDLVLLYGNDASVDDGLR